MAKDFLAHCKVVNGELEWKNPSYLHLGLKNLEGYNGVLTVKKKWNKRSLSQNSLYWMWLEIISQDVSHVPEELHIIFRGLFAPKKEVHIKTKSYMIPRSTTDLTKGEMVEYMFHVEQQANELGITLPHPEDLYA